ncbi:MAG: hydrogenase accessory protein HypB, partial [Methylocystis sp.]|nr:hydrogenase accessory protein HypB [Methylocystis sp.]
MCTVCGCGTSVVEDKDKTQKRDAHGHDHAAH